MKISMIVAYGNKKQLGMNNELLWRIPGDLKNFKNITSGHHLFMGRKTYDSILGYLHVPLPGRTSLVLSRGDINDDFDNVQKVSSFEEAIKIAEEAGEEELIIVGGASVYKDTFPLIDRLYLTEVDYNGMADCFFEGSVDSKFEMVEQIHYEEEGDVPAWTFTILDKR